MSPSSTLANARPTQKTTNTKIEAKFPDGVSSPVRPLHTITPSTATPTAPQIASTTPAAGNGKSRRPPVSPSSLGSGHRTARATNETIRTIAAAQPKSHSGNRQVGPADKAVSDQPLHLGGQGSTVSSAIGVLVSSSSISKTPSMSALKRESTGAARLDVLQEVVAVDVDLGRRVRNDLEADRVVLVDGDLLHAALRLSADHANRLDGGLGLRLRLRCRHAPSRLTLKRRLRGGRRIRVLVVVPAREQHEGEGRHDERRSDQCNPLPALHGASIVPERLRALAVRARAVQRHVVRLDGVGRPAAEPADRALERVVLERRRRAAVVAHQVVMVVAPGADQLVPRGAAGHRHALKHAQLRKQRERAVDARHPDTLAPATECRRRAPRRRRSLPDGRASRPPPSARRPRGARAAVRAAKA